MHQKITTFRTIFSFKHFYVYHCKSAGWQKIAGWVEYVRCSSRYFNGGPRY